MKIREGFCKCSFFCFIKDLFLKQSINDIIFLIMDCMTKSSGKARFHLPGLFEFFELYKVFVPQFYEHPQWFYPWCDIGSLYGAPADCLWGGGRVGYGKNGIEREVLDFFKDYGISLRLTFSNSMLKTEHLTDKKCNDLCSMFCNENNGIIIHSDLLMDYIKNKFPDFYFVSSTTKVLTDTADLNRELSRKEFRYVVPDFRLNRNFVFLDSLEPFKKKKVEFLCNECCWEKCARRKSCYENVSARVLELDVPEWECGAPHKSQGYRFSSAMRNQFYIGPEQIVSEYMPRGFSDFKIEGRSLGSALVLEMIMHYMVRPECQIELRENIYLDNSLDLF